MLSLLRKRKAWNFAQRLSQHATAAPRGKLLHDQEPTDLSLRTQQVAWRPLQSILSHYTATTDRQSNVMEIARKANPGKLSLISRLEVHNATALSIRSYTTSLRMQQPASSEKPSPTTVDPVWNWPNGISMARLLSGPLVGQLILSQQWSLAFTSLAISGMSDWLDGFVARRYNQGSVLGSYLDPLADKVLICCVAGALAIEGSLYAPLAYLIIGRDVFLVTGAFILRFRALSWKWPGYGEFFRTTADISSSKHQHADFSNLEPTSSMQTHYNGASRESTAEAARQSDPAPFVTPLYISKVNTVVQLALFAGCITSSWYHWPPETLLMGLGGLTGALTLVSGLEYYRQKRKPGVKP